MSFDEFSRLENFFYIALLIVSGAGLVFKSLFGRQVQRDQKLFEDLPKMSPKSRDFALLALGIVLIVAGLAIAAMIELHTTRSIQLP